jgi:penicillin G amidase
VLIDQDDATNTCWFARWIATVPAATNFDIMNLERATSAAEAVRLAPSIGIPHQNLVVGDREGHIAWTIAGRIPDTSDPNLRLTGEAPWTTSANHPQLIDPPAGRIWTANARSIDDESAEALIGGDEASIGADYDVGARARQIRDDLLAIKSPAKPADMLAVQLDDRGLFLTRWHDLLLQLLDDEALRDQPKRTELKRLIENWNARATPDSVGYRLVREFQHQTELGTWSMLISGLRVDVPEAPPPMQFEGPLWELVTKQPMHLLVPEFASWRAFLLAQIDLTLSNLQDECPQLDQCTWGRRREVLIRHPMSGAVPLLGGMFNMQAMQLPGDHDMPRVQDGSFGASERFAVTPGREADGYLHIAGAQSGHPLSPYYRAGFKEWAEGKPLPFLPGAAEHVLSLEPAP